MHTKYYSVYVYYYTKTKSRVEETPSSWKRRGSFSLLLACYLSLAMASVKVYKSCFLISSGSSLVPSWFLLGSSRLHTHDLGNNVYIAKMVTWLDEQNDSSKFSYFCSLQGRESSLNFFVFVWPQHRVPLWSTRGSFGLSRKLDYHETCTKGI